MPSYTTAAPGEAEALEVLTHLLGGGHTSLLYRELVIERKLAVAVGAYYMGTSLDATRLWIYAMPTPGTALEQLDRAVEEVIARVADHPVDEADLQRARTRLVADAIYAQDNQASLARWYGASLATGLDDRRYRPLAGTDRSRERARMCKTPRVNGSTSAAPSPDSCCPKQRPRDLNDRDRRGRTFVARRSRAASFYAAWD